MKRALPRDIPMGDPRFRFTRDERRSRLQEFHKFRPFSVKSIALGATMVTRARTGSARVIPGGRVISRNDPRTYIVTSTWA